MPVEGFLALGQSVYPYQGSRASIVRVALLSGNGDYPRIVHVNNPAE